MNLRRSLRRDLGDGKTITITRDYEVEFTALGSGYSLSGRQVSVEIDAPPSLARFAGFEFDRDDSAAYPVNLGVSGVLMDARQIDDSISLARAVAEALDVIADAGLPVDDQAQARAYISVLAQSAATANAASPPDLFVPPASANRRQDTISLPGGLKGTIAVEFSGNRAAASGLMTSAKRLIITELSGSRRTSEEHWILG
ncbi:hypothetical protein [Altererythrobacter aquiaggeris]|uniref:hypothetical protein n=1 Tax=Aestuarierythrobacter aquiaggeris TaxID=1898396 RepID=UPI0030192D8F